MKRISIAAKLSSIIAFYLLLIGLVGWGLLESYDLFLAAINKKVTNQTSSLNAEINAIQKIKNTDPASLKDIQNYDKSNNTHFSTLVMRESYIGMVDYGVGSTDKLPNVSSKEAINRALTRAINEKQEKITNIIESNRGFWSDLPKLSTLLLAGFGIFFTALITNFGNFISALITAFRKWFIGW